MTNEEAIEILQEEHDWAQEPCYVMTAIKKAIEALKRVEWENTLWHDAKTDPPKTPGLYYGKKDDTNSMYVCQYRDGVWVLDMYPQTKIDVVKWAEYTEFIWDNEKFSILSINREGWYYGICEVPTLWEKWGESGYRYCPHCGRPLMPEAWAELEQRLIK